MLERNVPSVGEKTCLVLGHPCDLIPGSDSSAASSGSRPRERGRSSSDTLARWRFPLFVFGVDDGKDFLLSIKRLLFYRCLF